MGERYKATLERKIKEFGGSNLRVFINAEGVNPHYKQHLEDTFRDAACALFPAAPKRILFLMVIANRIIYPVRSSLSLPMVTSRLPAGFSGTQ
jgi:hypothetical protein